MKQHTFNPLTTDEVTQLNKSIRKWLNKTTREIVSDLHAKGVRHSERSSSQQAVFLLVKNSLKLHYGMPDRASFKFPRHLVFVKYGVGKGRSRGSGKETPKDIVDNIIEKNLPQLADIVAEGYADLVVKNLFIDKTKIR